MTAAFAAALAAWGLVALAVYFAGADTYVAIARETHVTSAEFLYPPGEPTATPRRVDLATLVSWHERWSAYVLGRLSYPLRDVSERAFTEDEVRHIADVRNVFFGAQAVMYVAAIVAIALVGLALRGGVRTAGLLLRGGAAVAGAAVIAIGIVAAVAFEPAFLAFHYAFFPQGNFLFGPGSNLIRLYPEQYWYAVTLRVGATFVVMTAVVALIGWLMSRSGIVTRR